MEDISYQRCIFQFYSFGLDRWLLGRVVAEKEPKHRPPCPAKKSDDATANLSFLGVVIAAWLRLH